MTRQRWGTFAVSDHKRRNAFVADVLLYDRLIIPFPPDDEERNRWKSASWAPDRLEKDLEILGDLAICVPWDAQKQQQFKTRFETARDVGVDARNLCEFQKTKQDPYYLTRLLLAKELLPKLPKGVAKVWAVAAYPSFTSYQRDTEEDAKRERKEKLAMVLAHRFLVPKADGKPDAEILEQAVQLARRDDFRESRAQLNQWQEDIIEQDIPADKAVEEMEQLLNKYNDVVKRAAINVYWKYAFTVIPIALSLAGATLGSPLVAAAGLVSITKFAKFDRKPVIYAGECQAAAMLHDVHNNFQWGMQMVDRSPSSARTRVRHD